jgi:hypothetical protein
MVSLASTVKRPGLRAPMQCLDSIPDRVMVTALGRKTVVYTHLEEYE